MLFKCLIICHLVDRLNFDGGFAWVLAHQASYPEKLLVLYLKIYSSQTTGRDFYRAMCMVCMYCVDRNYLKLLKLSKNSVLNTGHFNMYSTFTEICLTLTQCSEVFCETLATKPKKKSVGQNNLHGNLHRMKKKCR